MSERKPNVVLVITDDQGYGDLGCHGNEIIRTPNMDALWGQSVRLTQFHVGPTCAPTRAGLMTGRYCNCTGVWHTIAGWSLLRKDEVTIGDVLRKAGYRTGLFGKWHLGDNYPFRPHDRGFDEALYHRGGGVSQAPDWWRNDYFDDTYYRNGTPEPHDGYCTDVWFTEGIKFIERSKDVPFFCYISTNAPHGPLNVPPRYLEPYTGKVSDHRARFYAMIENIDENLGRLRRRLEELGLAEDTVLIFMTDNGTATGCELDKKGFVTGGFNAGMRGKKGSEYDGGHRTPLFLHWPAGGMTGGRDVTRLTANIDVLPTLAELCGGRCPPHVYGRSLVPLLRGRDAAWPDRVIVTDSQRVETPQKWKQSATMTDRWRLVNGTELYDIQGDPEQRNDVAAEHPDVVEHLRGRYDKWWEVVSEKFDDEPAIILGSDREPTAKLSSHDWHTPQGYCPWNQADVRKGMVWNGYWALDVAQAGQYEFEVCRWPREVSASLTEGIAEDAEPPLPDGIAPGAEGWYVGGKALALKRATVKVGDQEQSADVPPGSHGVRFAFGLPAGRASLWAYFTDADDQTIGAFYVYVRRLGE